MVGISPQNTNCTNTGVPRNTHRYTHDTARKTGLGDNRMTARITARTIASSIDQTVSWMVTQTPLTIRVSRMYLPNVAQP